MQRYYTKKKLTKHLIYVQKYLIQINHTEKVQFLDSRAVLVIKQSSSIKFSRVADQHVVTINSFLQAFTNFVTNPDTKLLNLVLIFKWLLNEIFDIFYMQ